MSVHGDIHAYLVGLTTITDEFSTRVFVGHAPSDATFPYCVMSRISQDHDHHLLAASGFTEARFQFDIVGFDTATVSAASSAFDAAEALRTVLDGYQEGAMNGGTVVDSVMLEAEREDHHPPTDGSETGHYTISQDYVFRFTESIPAFPAT